MKPRNPLLTLAGVVALVALIALGVGQTVRAQRLSTDLHSAQLANSIYELQITVSQLGPLQAKYNTQFAAICSGEGIAVPDCDVNLDTKQVLRHPKSAAQTSAQTPAPIPVPPTTPAK